MQTAQINEHGTTDQIRISSCETPEPGTSEVLIDVHAAALNHLDLWVLNGLPHLQLDFPHVLGSDACGTVESTGPEVNQFQSGDRVVINPGISCDQCEHCRNGEHSLCDSFHLLGEHVDGTFAEYITVPERNVMHAPEHLNDQEAAAFPLVFLTAWRMLITRAELQPGEEVLIHGVGGGVSSATLQIASSLGTRCIVTSSSDEKLDIAAGRGADQGINYQDESVPERVEQLTGGRGVDVVVDNVGNETWQDSIQSAAKGGRIVTCGATTGPSPETRINQIFWNQLSIHGSTMGSHGDVDRMMDWLRQSRTTPHIDRVFPFEDVREAEQRLADGKQFGKIVLDMPG